jgi:hypothetical protein
LIDDITRDRILKQMLDRGHVAGHVAELLAYGIGPDGEWTAAPVNELLGLLTDRQILDRSHEIVRLAVDEPDIEQWTTIRMIDAVLDTYNQRDVAPLVDWLTDEHDGDL